MATGDRLSPNPLGDKVCALFGDKGALLTVTEKLKEQRLAARESGIRPPIALVALTIFSVSPIFCFVRPSQKPCKVHKQRVSAHLKAVKLSPKHIWLFSSSQCVHGKIGISWRLLSGVLFPDALCHLTPHHFLLAF